MGLKSVHFSGRAMISEFSSTLGNTDVKICTTDQLQTIFTMLTFEGMVILLSKKMLKT